METTSDRRFWWRRALAPTRAGRSNLGRTERIVSAAVGGGLLAAATRQRGPARAVLGILGVLGVSRAATGHSRVYEAVGVSSSDLAHGAGVSIDENVTINAPVAEVYDRWADVTQLPRYMGYLESVTEVAPGITTWVVNLPRGRDLTFDAEIIDQKRNEVVAWHTIPGARIEHSGSVRFHEVPGRGTELQLKLRFVPPAGTAGFAAARLFRKLEERGIAEELRRFKSVVEAGEAPTNEGPSGRQRLRETPPVVATAPVSVGGDFGRTGV